MWKEHFNNQFGNSSYVTDKLITKIINSQLNIKLGQFTEELNIILIKLTSGKAAGLEKIPPEVCQRYTVK